MGDRTEPRPKLPPKGIAPKLGVDGPYPPGIQRPQPRKHGGFPGTYAIQPARVKKPHAR